MGEDRETMKRVLECLMFASRSPVTAQSVTKAFPEWKRGEVEVALRELVGEWSDAGRGIVVVEVSGGYQFRTRPEHAEAVLRYQRAKPLKLSRAALEVLTIVAYRQPVTKVTIDKIRGVDSSGTLGALLERELVRIVGREEGPGRPFLYGTTERFLEVFSLRSLDELPPLRELKELDAHADPSETAS